MALHDGSHRVREMFFALCKSAGTPFALGLWIRFKYDHQVYLEASIDPGNYDDASTFRKDYQCLVYLSKYKCLTLTTDPEDEARKRFVAAEDQCRRYNRNLEICRFSGTNPELDGILHAATRKIAQILGPIEKADLESSFGWGPGATADLPRARAQVDNKLSKLPLSVTPRALPLARDVLGRDLHWSSVVLGVSVTDLLGPFCFLPTCFAVTPYSEVCTVPKNAKTHRTSAKEPTLNAFLQKGVGGWIRRRLKRVGIDLDDQSANQRAARAAYSGRLATIDLASASDTVSKELVYELLPVDWAILLDDLRSPRYRWEDVEESFHKFSSMGNGFTFELESLIFYALTWAVCQKGDSLEQEQVWIFGDDIICPSSIAPQVVEVLAHCGFSVNTEKSFLDGNFYESCGKHYFKGVDVTPKYQKEPLTVLPEQIRAANRLIRGAIRDGERLDPFYRNAWLAATRDNRELVEATYLPLGAEGDDGLLLPAESEIWARVRESRNRGLRCRVLRSVVRRLPANDAALLAWTLRRGVKTDVPFMGDVCLDDMSRVAFGYRWVHPSWEFYLNW